MSATSATRHFIPAAEWDDPRQRRGLAGERVALAYLTSCGWDIEAHRFRLGRHEIDLVARRGDLVAFVEVKTRRSARFGSGLEAVDHRKRRVLAKVAAVWRLRRGRAADSYRFDVIAISELSRGRYGIEHVEDAWRIE